jgi:pimeloyl-ACP methyl ester carboxylesterase
MKSDSPSEEYASEAELRQAGDAANFSQAHFFGMDMRGPLALVNLPALGTDFHLPVFIVQGEADLKAVPEVTRAYFERIHAPQKQFLLVPRAGHEPNAAMLAAMLQFVESNGPAAHGRPITLPKP